MASLHVKLFGAFEIHDGSGAPLGPLGRKSQALLAILALNPGAALQRDRLSALLWSDRGETQARSSLRQALTELRKALPDIDPSPLIADRETARIDPDAVEVDVATFERLIDEDTVKALVKAAELYRGDLLDGFDVRDAEFEEWLRDQRERLRARAVGGLSDLVDRQSGGDAIATARRLLALDPLNEAAHRALIRLYAEAGDRRMAILQYEACRDVLKTELGLAPEADTERLLEGIRGNAMTRNPRGGAVDRSTEHPRPFFDLSGGKTTLITGGCLCGDIRYEISEPAIDSDICHCRMCQKATGGQVVAGVTVSRKAFRFTKGEPKYYKSSPLAERGFCANCGSSLNYRPCARLSPGLGIFRSTRPIGRGVYGLKPVQN
jgi:DNA-binding SARP family transcriptional activator